MSNADNVRLSNLDSSISTSTTVTSSKVYRRAPNESSPEVPRDNEYAQAIQDLNSLQTNTQTLALAKYKVPEEILPLFRKQLNFAGITVGDLNRLNIIHVTGTKGKGSTCAFVERILRGAGCKTGFYNSPHLIKVNERIKINGLSIDDAKFSLYFRQIYDRLLKATKQANTSMPTYFSFLTILAYHVFFEEKVDCAIIEVGIGGQYDPTNVVEQPVACGISTLDYDHTSILGDSIDSIAWSKAGIAKRNCPLFTVVQEYRSAHDVIKSRADDIGSPLHVCKPLLDQSNLKLGIESPVQYKNAALACQLALQYLKTCRPKLQLPDPNHISPVLETDLSRLPHYFKEALINCSWPGRCQTIEYPKVVYFLDGAHTSTSMQNCIRWFQNRSNESSEVTRILMINIIGDRNKYDILKPLVQYERFDFVLFSTNKIHSLKDDLSSHTFQKIRNETSDRSLENAQNNADTWINLTKQRNGDCSNVKVMPTTYDCIRLVDDISQRCERHKCQVLVTGSLHFVGAILETLSKEEYLKNNNY